MSIRSVIRQNISGTSCPPASAKYSMTRTVTVTPSPESSARQEPSGRIFVIRLSRMSLFTRISACVRAMRRAIRAARKIPVHQPQPAR